MSCRNFQPPSWGLQRDQNYVHRLNHAVLPRVDICWSTFSASRVGNSINYYCGDIQTKMTRQCKQRSNKPQLEQHPLSTHHYRMAILIKNSVVGYNSQCCSSAVSTIDTVYQFNVVNRNTTNNNKNKNSNIFDNKNKGGNTHKKKNVYFYLTIHLVQKFYDIIVIITQVTSKGKV